MGHFYQVTYSWPTTFTSLGETWPTTAHGGFTAEFTRPVTEAGWPALAEWIENDRGVGPVTITSVTQAERP